MNAKVYQNDIDYMDLLIQARSLISDPDKWTKGANFRDLKNRMVVNIEEAYSFDLEGSLMAVSGNCILTYSLLKLYVNRALQTITGSFEMNQLRYNDACTHGEVLELLDASIDIAKRFALQSEK